MSVRAKFKVDSIERGLWDKKEMHTIKMTPVYANNDPEHENTKFWRYSPCGSLHLGTINAEAASQFELGAEYYIDFTKAGE